MIKALALATMLAVASFFVTGCKARQKLGELPTEPGVYCFIAEHGTAPATSSVVMVTSTGEVVHWGTFAEASVVPALLGAGGQVASAYVFGHELRHLSEVGQETTTVNAGAAATSVNNNTVNNGQMPMPPD